MTKLVGYVLITLVVLQVQSSRAAANEPAKDVLVKYLLSVNDIISKAGTYADNYFATKLKNESGIKEWSVNIQVDAAARYENQFFTSYEIFKKAVLSKSPPKEVAKVLNCVTAEHPTFLASVKSAASKNGFCNNRLAANLTLGFRATTKALLGINEQFKANIKSVQSCAGSSISCFNTFIKKPVDLILDGPNTGELGKAVQEVQRIYSIMFGEDVPRCNKEILFPQLREGLKRSFGNILTCATKQ